MSNRPFGWWGRGVLLFEPFALEGRAPASLTERLFYIGDYLGTKYFSLGRRCGNRRGRIEWDEDGVVTY